MRVKLLLLFFLLTSTKLLLAQRPGEPTDKKAYAFFQKGMAALQQNNIQEAEELFVKSLDEEESIVAHIVLADVYREKGDLLKGIEEYTVAIDLDPDFRAENYFHLAKLFFMNRNFGQAAKNIESYLKKPHNPKYDKTAEKLLRDAKFSDENKWEKYSFNPVNMGAAINSDLDEYYPALTGDDNKLFYTRKIKDSKTLVPGGMQEDFFISTKEEDWNASKNLGLPINTEYNEGAATISADGKLLIFTACELFGDGNYGQDRKGFGSCDLFYTYQVGNKWAKPFNLGRAVNTNQWETQPSLSSDGKTLYFIRGKRNRQHIIYEKDIWYSELQPDMSWSLAQKLPDVINTDYDETSVLIHPDGSTLYFTSEGHPGFGGEDIFYSKKDANNNWTTPVNVGAPINTNSNENSILVSTSGDIAYFASERAGGLGGLDLYQFEMPDVLKPNPVTYTKGIVEDAETGKLLEAAIELNDLGKGNLVTQKFSDPVTGEFLVVLPTGVDYGMNVSKEGYLFHSENFSLKEIRSANDPKILRVKLQPIKVGMKMVLKNIFFETNKFDLKPESETELMKLVQFLTKNASLKVEIGGHTDSVGEEQDNQVLSNNRAKAVYDFLITKGIAADRLAYKGYGESEPVDTNDTDEGRANNRRTEFKVIGG